MSPFLFNSIPVRDCACTHRPLRLWEYLISIFLLTSRIWVDRLRVPLVFRLQDFLFYYQCVTFHSTLEQELAATPAATRQLHKLIYIYITDAIWKQYVHYLPNGHWEIHGKERIGTLVVNPTWRLTLGARPFTCPFDRFVLNLRGAHCSTSLPLLYSYLHIYTIYIIYWYSTYASVVCINKTQKKCWGKHFCNWVWSYSPILWSPERLLKGLRGCQ